MFLLLNHTINFLLSHLLSHLVLLFQVPWSLTMKLIQFFTTAENFPH